MTHKQWIRTLSCAVCLRPGPNDAHHVRTKGAQGDQDRHLVPLCRICHSEWHKVGWQTFESKHQTDLLWIAEMLWKAGEAYREMKATAWQMQESPPPPQEEDGDPCCHDSTTEMDDVGG